MSKILCIEDNRLNLRLIKKLLSRVGIEVFQAETAWQGFQMAKSEQVQLILTNMRLPDMDGLELIRRLQADKELSHVPIIAMVKTSKPSTENPCELVSCRDVLLKPIIPQDLYNIVRYHIPEAFNEVIWFSED